LEEKYIVFVNPSFKTDTYRGMRNARKTGRGLFSKKFPMGIWDYGEGRSISVHSEIIWCIGI